MIGNIAQRGHTLRIAVGITMLILFLTGGANAATITVNASGGADYTSIQAAINNANAGDVIEVQSGIYLENVVVNKTLFLVGIGKPLVNARGSGTAITITTDGSTVDGFNVTGSGTGWNGGDADSGIKIKSDYNTVLNNTASLNKYGVYVFESINNTIEKNSVYGNTEGVYLFYSSNNSILGNNFSSNTNNGVYLSNSNNCTISNNTALKNKDGLYLFASAGNSLSNNTAYLNSNYGIYLSSSSNYNTLTNNNANGSSYGIYLSSSSNNTLTNNNANGRSFGIFMSGSSNNTLINNNANGSSYGIYLSGSSNNTLINNNANSSEYGIFIGGSGNTLTNNNANGSTSGIYLSGSGNTLTNNNANSSNYGIYLSGSGNTLTNNNANSSNYGIYLSGSGNTLTNNNANSSNYGIFLTTSSNYNTLTNNNANGNSNYGIYLSFSFSNTLTNNNANGNNVGIYLNSNCNNNILTNNNANGNSNYGIYLSSPSNYNTLTNNNANGNSNYGIYLSGSSGNTLTNNNANSSGTGIYLTSSSSNTMTNNNASDNTNYGIYLSGSGGNTLKQNDVLSNGYGLYISGSNGNTLLKNNFIDNINYNAYNTNGINSWSFNYYSDYTGSDSNNDGIGDTAYYIEGDSGARDLSPSMQPVPVLSVILSSPSSSSVSTLKGNPATFIATIDQVANITWILNGVMIQTNTSILTASYYNSSGQLGTHNLTVVADNVNGTDQKKWTWTVTEPPRPLITLSSPSSSSVSTLFGNSATFTATINQVANLTWILDGVTLYTNTSILTASYYNGSGQLGTHNLTVVSQNANGTDQKKWTWSVIVAPGPSITLSSPSSSSVSTLVGNSATFISTVDQIANVTWILDGVTLYTNTSILTASYYNSSGQLGTHNLTVVAVNANGADQKKWTWSVTVPAAPSITLSSPSSSSVSNIKGDSRTFIATVNQVATVTWILDGVTIQTNTSIQTASYHNSSAQPGVHNLTVAAVNANGADQKKWTWTVTDPARYTMQLLKGWNLISIPITPDTPDTTAVFGSNSDVILPIYTWNTASRQYYESNTIEIAKGYWVLALNDTTVIITGTP